MLIKKNILIISFILLISGIFLLIFVFHFYDRYQPEVINDNNEVMLENKSFDDNILLNKDDLLSYRNPIQALQSKHLISFKEFENKSKKLDLKFSDYSDFSILYLYKDTVFLVKDICNVDNKEYKSCLLEYNLKNDNINIIDYTIDEADSVDIVYKILQVTDTNFLYEKYDYRSRISNLILYNKDTFSAKMIYSYANVSILNNAKTCIFKDKNDNVFIYLVHRESDGDKTEAILSFYDVTKGKMEDVVHFLPEDNINQVFSLGNNILLLKNGDLFYLKLDDKDNILRKIELFKNTKIKIKSIKSNNSNLFMFIRTEDKTANIGFPQKAALIKLNINQLLSAINNNEAYNEQNIKIIYITDIMQLSDISSDYLYFMSKPSEKNNVMNASILYDIRSDAIFDIFDLPQIFISDNILMYRKYILNQSQLSKQEFLSKNNYEWFYIILN